MPSRQARRARPTACRAAARAPRPTSAGWQVWAAAALAFLGTPAWHYGRTLFCEPYLLAFAAGAYALALRRSSWFVAGVLIALGVSMKPPFVLLALPLGVRAMLDAGPRAVLRLGLPIALAVIGILSLNYHVHGTFFRSPIPWEPGNPLEGAVGLLLSRNNGLLATAPAVIPVLAAWPEFLRRYRRDALTLLAGFGLYFGLMATWIAWHGGSCFGPRMIVPVIPLLFAAAPVMPQCRWWSNKFARAAAIAACLASLLFNAVAAFAHGLVWNHHPLDVLAAWLAGT